MHIRKHIPNIITSLSLVSGCIATVMALQGNFLWATLWVIIAAVLDFMDGFAARMLKAYSLMGKELDSLADVVSFGVAPGMMLFSALRDICQVLPGEMPYGLIPYLAFVIPTFSGLRLAKFNIDERQTTSFIGLPVPAHALFWSSLVYTYHTLAVVPVDLRVVVCVALALAVATSLLLVSEIPMFSLKAKSLSWKGNELRYLLVACAIAFVVFLGFAGIAATILLYIILSIFNKQR